MLASERHGSGEPVVLIHGVTHRRQAWYPVLERLAEHREVILVDLPGHGESPPFRPGGRPVADYLADEFRTFLREQGLRRPHVVGHSLGGRIALEAGVRGDARSVTAFSPAGFWRTKVEFAHSRVIFSSVAALVERYGPRAEALTRSRAGRRLIYSVLMTHPARVEPVHALGDLSGFAYALPALRRLLAEATPFDGVLPADVPVLVAWGARDFVLPPWQAEVAERMLPRAEHVRLRGVGHVPMWDAPRQVAGLILRGTSSPTTGATRASCRAAAR